MCSGDLEADEEMKNGAAAGPLFIQSMHVVAVGDGVYMEALCLCTESTNKTRSLFAFPNVS